MKTGPGLNNTDLRLVLQDLFFLVLAFVLSLLVHWNWPPYTAGHLGRCFPWHCLLALPRTVILLLMHLLYFPSQYMKKLHMQERAVEEVKLAIKPFYQKREITKDEYKEILRKAVQKVGLERRPLYVWPSWLWLVVITPRVRDHCP